MKDFITQLSEDQKAAWIANKPKLGDAAAVGLAAFAVSTLCFQFYNIGWMQLGPVVWLGLIFGGLAQMIAGY